MVPSPPFPLPYPGQFTTFRPLRCLPLVEVVLLSVLISLYYRPFSSSPIPSYLCCFLPLLDRLASPSSTPHFQPPTFLKQTHRSFQSLLYPPSPPIDKRSSNFSDISTLSFQADLSQSLPPTSFRSGSPPCSPARTSLVICSISSIHPLRSKILHVRFPRRHLSPGFHKV